MALAEAALEELGLAPMWVRRGAARAGGVNEDATGAARETDVAAVALGAQPVSDAARRMSHDGAQGRGRGGAGAPAASTSADDASADGAAHAESIGTAALADGRAAPARQAADARGRARQAAAESGMRAADAPAAFESGARNSRDSTIARAASTVEPVAAGGARRVPPHAAAAAESAAFEQDAAQPARSSAASAPAARTGGDAGAAVADEDMSWFDLEPGFEPAPPDVAAEPAARAPSVAELGWDELRARVADCERCRLCEKRTNTVFGVGDERADWMLVGEAPGENEDKQGEPFVGQAGKLLDNMLRALALKRGENVYIANVIKCRPPGNRNPEPDEVARCEPYLQRQVALVKPKLIVALGRFAAQTLLKTDGSIASMRGRVHEYEGVPVIVTYHPAYLLRSLQDKAKAWSDLCLANDTYRSAAPAADPQ